MTLSYLLWLKEGLVPLCKNKAERHCAMPAHAAMVTSRVISSLGHVTKNAIDMLFYLSQMLHGANPRWLTWFITRLDMVYGRLWQIDREMSWWNNVWTGCLIAVWSPPWISSCSHMEKHCHRWRISHEIWYPLHLKHHHGWWFHTPTWILIHVHKCS